MECEGGIRAFVAGREIRHHMEIPNTWDSVLKTAEIMESNNFST